MLLDDRTYLVDNSKGNFLQMDYKIVKNPLQNISKKNYFTKFWKFAYNILSKIVWGNILPILALPTPPENLHFMYSLVFR